MKYSFVVKQNSFIYVYKIIQFILSSMIMFYWFHFYLLLIVIIKQNFTFVLPNQNIVHVNDQKTKVEVHALPSNQQWAQLKKSPGKDQLNARHLRDTRGNIMKSVFFIIGGVFILVLVGGIISIIVYYIKKK